MRGPVDLPYSPVMRLLAEDHAVLELVGLPKPGTRALVIGRHAQALAQRLSEGGASVEACSRLPESLEDASLDLLVASDWLEHEPWDRWELQRAHLALRPGARIAVAVRSLLALATSEDARFLAQRARKVLRARVGGPSPAGFEGRRYRLRALASLFESLGFRVNGTRVWGIGAMSPFAALAGLDRADAARGFALSAVRTPSLFGQSAERPFPDPEEHLRRFDSTQSRYEQALLEWRARHPEATDQEPRELDPGTYSGRTVLVLSPHPDDEIIGCGGFLLRAKGTGARVVVIQATDGSEAASLREASPAVRRTVRLEESERVARIMGFDHVAYWREDNASFRERDQLVRRLAGALEEWRPAAVFVPFPADVHPDHRTLGRLLAAALPTYGRETEIFGYEVWSRVLTNVWCDVTQEMSTLERALLEYPTALRVEDYVHFCRDRNYAHAIRCKGAAGYVEVFFRVSSSRYASLVDPD